MDFSQVIIMTDLDGTLLTDDKQILPQDLEAACRAAADSDFIKKHIPTDILDIYCKR